MFSRATYPLNLGVQSDQLLSKKEKALMFRPSSRLFADRSQGVQHAIRAFSGATERASFDVAPRSVVCLQSRPMGEGVGRILALDLGSVTGWAYRAENGVVASGVWKLGKDSQRRTVELYESLGAFERQGLTLAYELPRGGFSNARAAAALFELRGVVLLWAGGDVPQLTIHQSTLKKWATGNGRADKAAMRARAAELYPDRQTETHDEADALIVLSWAAERVDDE